MENKDKSQLMIEIKHIFDSGVNEERIFNMVVDFIKKRYVEKPEESSHDFFEGKL